MAYSVKGRMITEYKTERLWPYERYSAGRSLGKITNISQAGSSPGEE
jgi:hypothetical protein